MSGESKSNVYVSERLQNPETFQAAKREENFKWAGALAILSSILFLILLSLQYIEYAAVSVA